MEERPRGTAFGDGCPFTFHPRVARMLQNQYSDTDVFRPYAHGSVHLGFATASDAVRIDSHVRAKKKPRPRPGLWIFGG